MGEFLLVILIGLIGTSLIGGLALWGTVQLYNLVVRSLRDSWGVPAMPFERACQVAFVVSLIDFALHEYIQVLSRPESRDLLELLLIPVSFLSVALMVCFRLPTGFGRAVLITVCYVPVIAVIVAVLVGLVWLWRLAVQ
jgi:hypothetical protein